MRTAIRPSPPNNIPGGGGGGGSGILPPGNNYGIGRGGRMQTLNGGESNGIVPRIVSINRPQDLLDFVIQDERLSVGELTQP